ncbi:MAG: hypothetical protein RL307_64, partial [Pseudomonadota bacterium]
MKFTLTLASLLLVLSAAPSWAQSGANASAPKASAATKKKKPATQKQNTRKASHASEAVPTAVAPASPGLAPLNEAQLELAKNVQTGDIGCEDKVRVKVVPLPDAPGYFHVQIG